MKLKDIFQNYESPVDEAGWEAIANRPEVVKYNRGRLIRRVCWYAIPAVVVVTAVVTAVILRQPAAPASVPTAPVATEQTGSHRAEPAPAQQTVTEEQAPVATTPPAASIDVPRSTSAGAPATVVATPSSNASAQPKRLADNSSVANPTPTPKTEVSGPTPQQAESDIRINTDVPESANGQIDATASETAEDAVSKALPEESPEEASSEYTLYIPNAFTPNGDGLNDLFFAQGSFEPTQFEMAIYNRRGEIVFLSKEIKTGWDGMRYGSVLPTDVYTYVIQYTDPAGKKHTRRGQITLVN